MPKAKRPKTVETLLFCCLAISLNTDLVNTTNKVEEVLPAMVLMRCLVASKILVNDIVAVSSSLTCRVMLQAILITRKCRLRTKYKRRKINYVPVSTKEIGTWCDNLLVQSVQFL